MLLTVCLLLLVAVEEGGGGGRGGEGHVYVEATPPLEGDIRRCVSSVDTRILLKALHPVNATWTFVSVRVYSFTFSFFSFLFICVGHLIRHHGSG